MTVDEAQNWDERILYSPDLISKETATGLSEYLSMAYLTLGWMNCRNVEVVDESPSRMKARKRQRKGGLAGLQYKKIILDGRSRHGLASNREAEKRRQRLHVVRGHFKTYTADKPLMGKYVGQYWWHQQTRGDMELGVIHHEYDVKGRSVK